MAFCTKCGTQLADDANFCAKCGTAMGAAVMSVGTGIAQEDINKKFAEAKALYDKGRYDEAVPLLKSLAEQGHAEAQSDLGLCYDLGKGVTKDGLKAVEWYHKASEQGNALAQFRLGTCYREGQRFGGAVPQDYAKALEWFRKASAQGQALSSKYVGDFYRYGHGVTQDYAKAAEWYRKSVEQGGYESEEEINELKAEGKI